MNSTRSFTLVRILLLAVLAAGLSASLANAQELGGKFTLPFEARWGRATLPPGDYSFNLNTAVAPYTVTVRGEKCEAMIIPMGSSDSGVSGHSELIAVRSGGKYRIRGLHLGKMGLVFTYGAPKAERQFLAQAPELIRRAPIAMTGK